MSDATPEQVETLIGRVLDEAAQKNLLKKMREISDDLYGYIEFQLKDDLAGNLTSLVHQMADGAIEQLLAGNEERMRHYLNCDEHYTGREGMDRFIVIHGKINEHGPITLRRKIVEAFPDLLRNERINDLEAQVAALLKEVARVEADRDRIREYYRGETA